ncbi:MATE family efflux transporter [Paracoccaceae bacterium GXU_MW_L88]
MQQDPSWKGHLMATLRLAVPLVGAQLAQIAIGTTDTVMVGRLGAYDLAAAVLGTQFYFIIFIFGSGFAYAVMPMASGAAASDDVVSVRRSVRMGLWVNIAFAIITIPLMWFSGALLIAFRQQPDLAMHAQSYIRIAMWALLPALTVMTLRSYLSALERAGMVLFATLAGFFANILLNYALIFGNFGFPALGLRGAAFATVGTNIVMAGALLIYVNRAGFLKRFNLFQRFWRADWSMFGAVVRLGLPISATLVAEVGMFVAVSLMVGWIGTVELAAHGIALQITSVGFMIPLGLASVATVRVGRAVGRNDAKGLRRASLVIIYLTIGVTVALAIILTTFREGLVGLFLDLDNPESPEILAIGAPLLLIAAAFQLVDGLQAVGAGLLRGIKDMTVTMIIALISYWVIGLGSAYLMAFVWDYGVMGIWAGLAFGLAGAAIAMTWRYFRGLGRVLG